VENDGKVTRRRLFSVGFLPTTIGAEAVAIQSAEAVTAIVRITVRTCVSSIACPPSAKVALAPDVG
jgi:hypothetical protein